MSFAVEWDEDALSDLALWWMQGPDRAAITKAQARIDQLLAAAPEQFGQYVREDLYCVDVPPLRAYFEIHEDTHIVEVTGVARTNP